MVQRAIKLTTGTIKRAGPEILPVALIKALQNDERDELGAYRDSLGRAFAWMLDEERGQFVANQLDREAASRVNSTWYRIEFKPRDSRLKEKEQFVYGIYFDVYMRPSVFEKAQALQREEPLYLGSWFPRFKNKQEGKFWWYRDKFWISTMYSEEEARLLLWEKGRREQRKFERLAKAKAAAKEAREEAGRERIPEEVRLLVWERDGGRCVKCGSTEDLEFDHIIPVSKGGSNTGKNVQLLCARCNREKGDRIA